MLKVTRIIICLLLLATTGAVWAQDTAICETLEAAYTTHGDSLKAYLSDKGKECLKSAAAPTVEPTAKPSGPIWSAKGQGKRDRSVSLT